MKKLAILSISLLIFVFLAGCVDQQTTDGSGMVIKSFTAIPPTIEPDTPVLLQLDIQNTGGAIAKSVTAELLGLTDEWTTPEGTPIDDVRKQDDIGDLYPSDPSRGITEGEERVIEWDLSAPGRPRDMPYSAGAHVSYYYNTTLEAQIKAVTSGYLRQTGETGGIVFQDTTPGPFSIKLIAPTTVISGGKIPVQIQIQNTGGGYVDGNRLTLRTSDDLVCPKTYITLIGGKGASLYCTLQMDSFTNYKIFPITIATEPYNYWIEKETSITVLKSPVTA